MASETVQPPTYDIFCFGNISIDIIRTPSDETIMTGGAILYAAWVAHQMGHRVGVLTKTSKQDKSRLEKFPVSSEDLTWIESKETTSILNDYQTADMERRICTNRGQAGAFTIEDFPDFSAQVIQYSALITGEIDLNIIKFLAGKAKLAVDAQGMVRKVMPSKLMEFTLWDEIRDALPYIHYFKVDAAEAEFLTGIQTDDRKGRIEAAQLLLKWGAKEVILSHNQELLIVMPDKIVTVPFHNRSLDGRTGRGDTCTATYITERLSHSPEESAQFAAALTSMKMEVPGPFQKTRGDVEAFIKEFY